MYDPFKYKNKTKNKPTNKPHTWCVCECVCAHVRACSHVYIDVVIWRKNLDRDKLFAEVDRRENEQSQYISLAFKNLILALFPLGCGDYSYLGVECGGSRWQLSFFGNPWQCLIILGVFLVATLRRYCWNLAKRPLHILLIVEMKIVPEAHRKW